MENMRSNGPSDKVPPAKKPRPGVRATVSALALATVTPYLVEKGVPDPLPEPTPTAIEWNESTTNEIKRVARTYAERRRNEGPPTSASDAELQKRFQDFVALHLPQLAVVFYGKERTIDEKVSTLLFRILDGHSKRPRAGWGHKIYYERNSPDQDRVQPFIAEISHHINKDSTPRRMAAYLTSLVRIFASKEAFGATYSDPFSVEFQAHAIAEGVIQAYLFSFNDHTKNIPFYRIYNLYLQMYTDCLHTFKNESPDTISFLYRVLKRRAAAEQNTLYDDPTWVSRNIASFNVVLNLVSGESQPETRKAVLSLFIKFPPPDPSSDWQAYVPIVADVATLSNLQSGTITEDSMRTAARIIKKNLELENPYRAYFIATANGLHIGSMAFMEAIFRGVLTDPDETREFQEMLRAIAQK